MRDNALCVCSLCGAPQITSAAPIETRALRQLAADLTGVHESCWRFFRELFVCDLTVSSHKVLCRELAIHPSTLITRFERHGLPSPRRYLVWARLVRAAALLEHPGNSVAYVALAMGASSPQSYGRSVRSAVGVTPATFRRDVTADAMLQRFRDELVLPYVGTLRQLSPLVERRTRHHAAYAA